MTASPSPCPFNFFGQLGQLQLQGWTVGNRSSQYCQWVLCVIQPWPKALSAGGRLNHSDQPGAGCWEQHIPCTQVLPTLRAAPSLSGFRNAHLLTPPNSWAALAPLWLWSKSSIHSSRTFQFYSALKTARGEHFQSPSCRLLFLEGIMS